MKRHAVVALLLFSWLLPAAARAADLGEVVRTLESPFRSGAAKGAAIRDFAADFSQESKIASLDRTQQGGGRVAIRFVHRDPAQPPLVQFRWDYTQPNNQVIVSDGKTMWVYVPENRQVIESDIAAVDRTDGNDPLTFLTGLGDLGRDFTIALASPDRDAAGNWVLELTPRKPSPLVVRLRIVVDRRAVEAFSRSGNTGGYLPLRSSLVVDAGGNSTLIEFSHIRINRGLGDQDFRFTVPAGVEVVRPGGQQPGS
jgi:outer membrane lipoprotein carrier protein